jgi:small nuclear ribonucleoprotein (snRNP)-like protein
MASITAASRSPSLAKRPADALSGVQLIFSVFKTLTDQEVTVELKNDLSIVGTLKSVDQFLNIKLDNIRVLDEERHPHMVCCPCSSSGRSSCADPCPLSADCGAELLYSRLCSALRAATEGGGGYSAVGGCHQTRSVSLALLAVEWRSWEENGS